MGIVVAKLKAYFSALAANQGFDGNVLVAENGKVIYEASFGYADYVMKRRNTADTLFPIASITKTLMSTAILQQVGKRKLRLDDSVATYLPGFPYKQITVRQLLAHTSGMPAYNAFFDAKRDAEPAQVFTNADFIPGVKAKVVPLTATPGEKWEYSNTNYLVLALILETVSGESYTEYIRRHILKPVGMNHTAFFPHIFNPARNGITNLALPHWYPGLYATEPIRADTIKYVSEYWGAYQFSGFGDFISTTQDLLKYDQALYDGTLADLRLMEEAFTQIKLTDGTVNPGLYGLGWSVSRSDAFGKVVYHEGDSIGLSCVLYRNITRKQTVIFV